MATATRDIVGRNRRRQEDGRRVMSFTGVVEEYDATLGVGIIRPLHGGPDVLVHKCDFPLCEFMMRPSTIVQYLIVDDASGSHALVWSARRSILKGDEL